MRKACITIAFLGAMYVNAQVGIGTTDPIADLHVVANPSPDAGSYNGIIIPKVAVLPTTTAPSGLIIYLTAQDGTNNPGIYYSNGTNYINLTDVATVNSGDTVRARYPFDTGIDNPTPGSNNAVIRWFKVNYPSQVTSSPQFASGTYTASVAGYYDISAHIQSTFGTGNEENFFGLAIYKNGIRIQANQSRNSRFEDFIRRSVSGIHYLEVGETIEIYLGFPENFNNFNNIESDFSELIIKRLK